MPRIAAATVVENREFRRDALLRAAATLIQRRGGFTVAEVAREVGLSRSAVYEYYDSAADLIADVLVDELAEWSDTLERSTPAEAEPRERIHAWIHGILTYVVDGRHALLRGAAKVDLPPARRAEVQDLHQALIAPLVIALRDLGTDDPVRLARFVWGVVDVAITRIESGADGNEDIVAVTDFVDGALGMRDAGAGPSWR